MFADKMNANRELINQSNPSQIYRIHGYYQVVSNGKFKSIRGRPSTKINFRIDFQIKIGRLCM